MRKLSNVIIITLCFFLQLGFAAKEEVVLQIDNHPFSNTDIAKRISVRYQTPISDSAIDYYFEEQLPHILTEYYSQHNNITVSDREVTDKLEKESAKRAKSIDEYIKGSMTIYDKSIDDVKKRLFQWQRDGLFTQKAVRHYAPDVDDLTEVDIKNFVDYYRNTYHPPVFGHKEAIKFKFILVLPDASANKDVLRASLNSIKDRLNKGEEFQDIASEYSDNKNLSFNIEPEWQVVDNFEKEGLDAISPWKTHKDSAVTALWKAMEGSPLVLLQIVDYMPNTRKEVGEALKDKSLRDEVLNAARSYKFGKAFREMIKELETKVKYIPDKETAIKKVFDAYNE